jgi:hypothetical protein
MRRETPQINKIRNEKGDMTSAVMKSRESLGITLKTYIQINWKIQKKWVNF